MQPDLSEAREMAGRLTGLERDLLLGHCTGWGSWMFEAGSYMVSQGLGTKQDGSIRFDTPLGLVVRAILQEQTNVEGGRG